jgi:hypothetical protein
MLRWASASPPTLLARPVASGDADDHLTDKKRADRSPPTGFDAMD